MNSPYPVDPVDPVRTSPLPIQSSEEPFPKADKKAYQNLWELKVVGLITRSEGSSEKGLD